jgi:hypothetical protein
MTGGGAVETLASAHPISERVTLNRAAEELTQLIGLVLFLLLSSTLLTSLIIISLQAGLLSTRDTGFKLRSLALVKNPTLSPALGRRPPLGLADSPRT